MIHDTHKTTTFDDNFRAKLITIDGNISPSPIIKIFCSTDLLGHTKFTLFLKSKKLWAFVKKRRRRRRRKKKEEESPRSQSVSLKHSLHKVNDLNTAISLFSVALTPVAFSEPEALHFLCQKK